MRPRRRAATEILVHLMTIVWNDLDERTSKRWYRKIFIEFVWEHACLSLMFFCLWLLLLALFFFYFYAKAGYPLYWIRIIGITMAMKT